MISSNVERKGLTNAVVTSLKQAVETIASVEVVAWSLKLDDLNLVPRVFDDIIILVELKSNIDRFRLIYLRRQLSGGITGLPWSVPSYPPLCKPPIALIEGFGTMPSETELSKFMRSSDIGCNSFDPMVRVVDVVLYRHSQVLEKTLTEGIDDTERERRHAAHVACFIEYDLVK